MGLPKEQEEQESPSSPIRQLLIKAGEVVFGHAKRGERKKLEEKKTRFLALGKTLAQNIGAFEGLALEEGFERDFFVERLSIHLFHALCPLNPNPSPEETLNGKRNERDRELDAYFGKLFDIGETFGATDDVQMCLLKRALNYAARNTFPTIAQDLKETCQGGEFVSKLTEAFKRKNADHQDCLYRPSEQAKEKLQLGFVRDVKDIESFRALIENRS